MNPQKKRKIITVGTRGSTLARIQSRHVISLLETGFPDHIFQEKIVVTRGDASEEPLQRPGDVDGIFTRAIEDELVSGTVDMAVHSYKDLPSILAEGLMIGAVTERFHTHDVLVGQKYSSLEEFPSGSTIGTSSPRRAALIRRHFPRITCVPVRGNVETRIQKCDDGIVDGLILARAGLERLGMAGLVRSDLDMDYWYYAPGQGALAIEIRDDDRLMKDMTAVLDDQPTRLFCRAEKSFSRVLGAGCHVPFGVRVRKDGETLILNGMISSNDASVYLEESGRASVAYPEGAGEAVAKKLIQRGADRLLRDGEGFK